MDTRVPLCSSYKLFMTNKNLTSHVLLTYYVFLHSSKLKLQPAGNKDKSNPGFKICLQSKKDPAFTYA